MDYTTMSEDQLKVCHRLLTELTGEALNAKQACEFVDLGRMGYLAAWQEFVNMLGELEADLVRTWEVTARQEAPS